MPRNDRARATITEAAQFLGVSVDTMRRYDDSGVFRQTTRSPGGQRRFLWEELERVRDNGAPRNSDPLPDFDPPEPPPPEAPRARVVQPWEAREAEANADVAVTRSRIERREAVRRYREAEDAREEAARAQAEARNAEARERQAANERRERAQRALDSHLSSLRVWITFERPPARAEIEKFLADHAHTGVSLAWLNAEVDAIRERHAVERSKRDQHETREREERERRAQQERDEQARQEQHRREKDQRRNVLLDHGNSVAWRETMGADWDLSAGVEAREEVKKRLEAEVGDDWTERDVEGMVEDVLAEWE